jgi:hypothetical protein
VKIFILTKLLLFHELTEDDFDRRTEFCEIMMNKINRDDNFINHVLFSDESNVCLNGHVNRHNCRYWADRYPHWMEEVHTQRPQKINAWCGIIGRNIIGPFFIDCNLTSAKYLQLLQQVIPRLRQIFVNYEDRNILAETVWFQQDGAPPHFGLQVRQYQDVIFQDKYIGRRGAIEWPASSPDLTALDFFLWGHLKNRVYVSRPLDTEEFKQCITNCKCIFLQVGTSIASLQNFVQGIDQCQEVNEEHFEHLL